VAQANAGETVGLAKLKDAAPLFGETTDVRDPASLDEQFSTPLIKTVALAVEVIEMLLLRSVQ
jgi:hypothetical protein